MEDKCKIFLDLSEIQDGLLNEKAFRAFLNENQINLDFNITYEEIPTDENCDETPKKITSAIIISSAIGVAILLGAIGDFYKDMYSKDLEFKKLENLKYEEIVETDEMTLEGYKVIQKKTRHFNE